MRAQSIAAALLFAASCSAPIAPPLAQSWATPRLVAGAKAGKEVAGFQATTLITLATTQAPFRGEGYEEPPFVSTNDALSVLPAFKQGKPEAYVVMEVWENYPDPWVQPIYIWLTSWNPSDPLGNKLPVPTTIGVGDDSTFYSPYWQAVLLVGKTTPPAGGAADAREALGLAKESHLGPQMLCPVVPAGFELAGNGAPRRPLTGQNVVAPSGGTGKSDGEATHYFNFGPRRFVAYPDGRLDSTRIFFFVGATGTLLELPAVLSDLAAENAYARRFDVRLDERSAWVFIPAGPQWQRVRDGLKGSVGLADASPQISPELAAAYTLRVATDASCFHDPAAFPAGCTWLDSEKAIDAQVDPTRLARTEVTLDAILLVAP